MNHRVRVVDSGLVAEPWRWASSSGSVPPAPRRRSTDAGGAEAAAQRILTDAIADVSRFFLERETTFSEIFRSQCLPSRTSSEVSSFKVCIITKLNSHRTHADDNKLTLNNFL